LIKGETSGTIGAFLPILKEQRRFKLTWGREDQQNRKNWKVSQPTHVWHGMSFISKNVFVDIGQKDSFFPEEN
jgi:hypothetical protein